MRELKILIPVHVMPNVKNAIIMFVESILPELRKKSKVHVIWFVYQPEKQNPLLGKDPDETTIFIQDYKNGIDVLEKEKPDLVFASATWSFIDYALSSSAKYLNIPVFSMFWSDWYYGPAMTIMTRIKLLLARFFENSIPTDTNQNQKRFMRRGRFYIYKFIFLLKTHRAMNMSIPNMLNLFFFMIRQIIFDAPVNPRFENTVNFLEDEDLKKSLLQAGYKTSSLVVVGNPLFDTAFQKSQKKDMLPKKVGDCLIRILFAPSALYEHGMWTKNQKDSAVKQIISAFAEKKDELSIIVKLHPSSSLLSEYEPIIHSIDDSISVYQNGGIQQFLDDVDVSISFQSSTAEVYAMIAKKPIVICNFFGSKTDKFVENGIAFECKNSSELVNIIHQSMSDMSYEKNRENFIRKFMYKGDGLAAERITNKIISLLEHYDV